MQKLTRLLGLVALMTASLSAPAHATMKQWLNMCSSGSLVTCASVKLWVTGTTVMLEIQNLSSGTAADSPTGYRGTVFYSVGLRNVPAGVIANSTFMNMSGPKGATAPSPWAVTRTGADAGGAINVSSSAAGTAAYANGIASNCATTAGGTNLVPAATKLWMTPTCGTTNVTSPTLNAGWVDISILTNQTWDPIAMNTTLVLNGIDEQGRLYQIDYAFGTNPEPFTVILLATGLAAMGGAQARRRRRLSRDLLV
jgi:hypothetical protein